MSPRIVYSPLSKSWFVVTRYTKKQTTDGVSYIVASRKYDVTDQMEAILSKQGKAAIKCAKPARVMAELVT